MNKKTSISRRATLKGIGALGAAGVLGSGCTPAEKDHSKLTSPNATDSAIADIVHSIPLIDTHEHLIEEYRRFDGSEPLADDWTYVLSHYFESDLITAGMSKEDHDKFFSKMYDPIDKWKILKPYWPAVKNTGYGQAVRIAIQKLYGVDELRDNTIRKIQAGYEKTRKPGFYKTVLKNVANIESCQVNCLDGPFAESSYPTLLFQDLSFVGMHQGPYIEAYRPKTGLQVNDLADWHKVIDWWFAKYAPYAVAIKSQGAYGRDIDFELVEAEQVESIFKRKLSEDPLTTEEQKKLEDHLFWYAVHKADEYNLPVKLHTGYYVGHSAMPLGRLQKNPASASNLCRLSPKTRFVFMHITYPYYEEMIALAKHYKNAYLDMCWAWIINPVASMDFLKKYLVTAPANKVFTFGGDYGPVEPVVGHAEIARRGIALVLSQLVAEKHIARDDAPKLAEMVMHNNAYDFFNLAEKTKILEKAPWL